MRQGTEIKQGTVLKGRIMDDPNVMIRFKKALEVTFDPSDTERLLEKYALVGKLIPEQQYTGLLNLATDLRFYFPILKVAAGWACKNSSKCVRYHFHQVGIGRI
jgi:hypothetical protein